MTVKVLLFAQARQLVGSDSAVIEIESDATVEVLRKTLADKHPELESLLSRSSIAVNQQYATNTDSIPDGAEVAMIPPVSGG